VTLCGGVSHKIGADDTPAYAHRSDQEKQYTNIQGSTATTPKEKSDEKRNSASSDNQMIKDVPVHGADCIDRSALQPRRRERRSRNFLIRPRAFVGCKRLLGRRLAGPLRCGAGSALIVT